MSGLGEILEDNACLREAVRVRDEQLGMQAELFKAQLAAQAEQFKAQHPRKGRRDVSALPFPR